MIKLPVEFSIEFRRKFRRIFYRSFQEDLLKEIIDETFEKISVKNLEGTPNGILGKNLKLLEKLPKGMLNGKLSNGFWVKFLMEFSGELLKKFSEKLLMKLLRRTHERHDGEAPEKKISQELLRKYPEKLRI